jgi:hypothetical protein
MSGVTRGDFGKLRKETHDLAYDLDKVTRPRVDQLEAWVYVFSHMSFLRRMRWLLTGK